MADIVELAARARRLRRALPTTVAQKRHSPTEEDMLDVLCRLTREAVSAHNASQHQTFPPKEGYSVTGTYLHQKISGTVKRLQKLATSDIFRIEVDFDAPVNVSTLPGSSVFRSKVSCLIDENGVSISKTSSGRPYLALNPPAPSTPSTPPARLTIQRI